MLLLWGLQIMLWERNAVLSRATKYLVSSFSSSLLLLRSPWTSHLYSLHYITGHYSVFWKIIFLNSQIHLGKALSSPGFSGGEQFGSRGRRAASAIGKDSHPPRSEVVSRRWQIVPQCNTHFSLRLSLPPFPNQGLLSETSRAGPDATSPVPENRETGKWQALAADPHLPIISSSSTFYLQLLGLPNFKTHPVPVSLT